jgi:DNA gyrase subunit B
MPLIQLIILMSLSQTLEVTVWRDGKEHRQSYSRGKPTTRLTSSTLTGETSSRQGTRIRFWPDKDSKLIFLQISCLV